jgi:Family of unknown function (DUF6221)
VNDEKAVAWLREQVQARKARAQVALNDRGEWSVARNADFDYTVFPRRPTTPGDAVADAWREDIAVFIAANDPRQIIADCEKDLAILERYRAATEDFTHVTENVWEFSRRETLEGVVELVASGYKYWPGYAEHWGSA